MTSDHREVACLKVYGEMDDNNVWQIVLTKHMDPHVRGITLRTAFFQLVNRKFDCALSMNPGTLLPEWGFYHQEVTCNPNYRDPIYARNTIWSVDENTNDNGGHSPAEFQDSMTFWAKITEMHSTSWSANQGFTEAHPYQSPPENWPFLERGVSYWTHERKALYLLGNPVVWWMCGVCVGVFLLLALVIAMRVKRGLKDHDSPHVQRFENVGRMLTVAWALHFAPFFLMKRQLFLHHYLPALYFSMLLTGVVFDFIFGRAPRPVRVSALVIVVAVVAWAHFQFLFVIFFFSLSSILVLATQLFFSLNVNVGLS